MKKQTKNFTRQIFWSLPHDFRRLIYANLYPEVRHANFSSRKIEGDGFSLKHFDDYHCIFVHIPKAAGIAVSKSLFSRTGASHIKLRNYKLIFSEREFNAYFKFTFVRNPWDRLVSAYEFLKQGGYYPSDAEWYNQNLNRFKSFEEFVLNWLNEQNVFSWIHFVPQYDFLCTTSDHIDIDFIGKYETIQNDYKYVRSKLGGIGKPLRILNKNMNREKNYRAYYNSQTRKIVSKVYQEDIELFGYEY